jgi:putative hydrolase of the HAD superfamily
MDLELDAAIFDLGGVLTTPIRDAFASFELSLGAPAGSLLKAFIAPEPDGLAADYHSLETGHMTEADYYQRLGVRLREVTGLDIMMPDDPVAVRRAMFSDLRPNDEMLKTVGDIKKHYRVGLLTNNVREWGRWRELYPMDLFDAVVDSSEVGMRKPDPAIYKLACERLDVLPGRAAFVDDLHVNVEGARAVGLTAIQFTTTGEVLDRLRPLFPKAFEDG